MIRGRVCVLCGSDQLASQRRMSYPVCRTCKTPQLDKERKRYQANIKRAQRAKLPAALTFKEWITILNYFDWKCAYCREKQHVLMEHIVSISKGGGTVASNVVPACAQCNMHKDRVDSGIYRDIMPRATLERVKSELAIALVQTNESL